MSERERRQADVDALRVTTYDPELQADVRRVVGYTAHCPCKWHGKARRTVYVARADLHLHKITAHGHKPT